jgi:hypothetical protein
MIGRLIFTIIVIVIIYALFVANGFASSELMGHIQSFLEAGNQIVVSAWEFITQAFTESK